MKNKRSLISILDLSVEEIDELLAVANDIIANPENHILDIPVQCIHGGLHADWCLAAIAGLSGRNSTSLQHRL